MKLVKCDKCGGVVDPKLAETFKLVVRSKYLAERDWCNECSGMVLGRTYDPTVPETNCETIMAALIEELVERGVKVDE